MRRDHAPFRDSLSSIGWDLLWSTCSVLTVFEVSLFTHYEDTKDTKNAEIGVAWG